MSIRRKMLIDDWLNGTALLAVGVFLGLAVGEWVKLEGTAFWLTIIYVFIPFGLVFLFEYLLDYLADRSFFRGIKPAPSNQWKKLKPLALLASLPAGVVIGVTGVQFGLSEMLL